MFINQIKKGDQRKLSDRNIHTGVLEKQLQYPVLVKTTTVHYIHIILAFICQF